MDAKLNQIISKLDTVSTKFDRHIASSDERSSVLEATQSFIIRKLTAHDE